MKVCTWNINGVRAREGDVHDLQFADASQDFVFSNIFDHVLFPQKFIAEIKRVLKPRRRSRPTHR